MTIKDCKKNRYFYCRCVEDENAEGEAEGKEKLLMECNDKGSNIIRKDEVGNFLKEIVEIAINNNKKSVKRRRLPKIQVLEKKILNCIIGQDMPVRQIITAIYRSKKFKDIKSNVLIIGKSGTGKTETIKQIAKRLKLPYTIEDATKYTQEGYVGSSVEDMLYNLLENAEFDIDKAQNGIIVVDEIDKKNSKKSIIGSDPSGDEVLKSMLKMIEGTVFKIQDPENPFGGTMNFNTENLIIIFSGAFVGLEKIQNERGKMPLGFVTRSSLSESTKTSKIIKNDLIKYGMPEEFVGRIDTIIVMNDLTKNDLVTILKRSELSIFRKYEKSFKKRGVSLEYDDEIFEHIAEEALTVDTGARELNNVVNNMFEKIVYQILANPRKYKKCKLSLEIVKDNSKFELS